MRVILLFLVVAVSGCGTTSYVARHDHFKIVRSLHTKDDVRQLMGEPLYEGPFRRTFALPKVPAHCPGDATAFHYLARYESVTGGFGKPFRFRQADVILFDRNGVVCEVASRACPNDHGADRCYEEAELGIEEPWK